MLGGRPHVTRAGKSCVICFLTVLPRQHGRYLSRPRSQRTHEYLVVISSETMRRRGDAYIEAVASESEQCMHPLPDWLISMGLPRISESQLPINPSKSAVGSMLATAALAWNYSTEIW